MAEAEVLLGIDLWERYLDCACYVFYILDTDEERQTASDKLSMAAHYGCVLRSWGFPVPTFREVFDHAHRKFPPDRIHRLVRRGRPWSKRK